MTLKNEVKRRVLGGLRKIKSHLGEEDDVPEVEPPGLPAGEDVTAEAEQAMLDEWSAALQAELEELGREVEMVSGESVTSSTSVARERSTEPVDADEREAIEARSVELIRTVFDPEIPVDIYELGLIYGVQLLDDRDLSVTMTLTSPNCPAAQSMPAEVETKLREIDGVNEVVVEITFDPPWDPSRMSEAARLELNLF